MQFSYGKPCNNIVMHEKYFWVCYMSILFSATSNFAVEKELWRPSLCLCFQNLSPLPQINLSLWTKPKESKRCARDMAKAFYKIHPWVRCEQIHSDLDYHLNGSPS